MRPLPPQLGPALGALARGRAAGRDGRTDGRTEGRLRGKASRQPVPVRAEMLARPALLRGPPGRDGLTPWHHGPASTPPPTPLPCLRLLSAFGHRQPPPAAARPGHSGEGTGAAASPGDAGTLPWPGPTFLRTRLAGCIDFIFCFHGNCLLPFPLPAAGPAPSPSCSTQPRRHPPSTADPGCHPGWQCHQLSTHGQHPTPHPVDRRGAAGSFWGSSRQGERGGRQPRSAPL